MDKLNCKVVRDLLPLVVDEVASDESRTLVEEHLAGCETCRAYRDGMTTQLNRPTALETETSVIRTFQKVEHKLRLRKIVTTMAVLLLVFVLALSGYWVYEAKVNNHVPMLIENARASLVRSMEGKILLRLEMQEGYSWYDGYWMRWDNGNYYIIPTMPEWEWASQGNAAEVQLHRLGSDLCWEDGQLVRRTEEWDVVFDEETESYVDQRRVHEKKIEHVYWGDWDNCVMIYDAQTDAVPLVSELDMIP